MSIISIVPYTIADMKSLRKEYIRQRGINEVALAGFYTQLNRALDEDKPFIFSNIHELETKQEAIQNRII